MFFIIKRQRNFVKKKKNFLPTRRSFIFKKLNKKTEYFQSIYLDYRIKKYKTIVSNFIWSCFVNNNFIKL